MPKLRILHAEPLRDLYPESPLKAPKPFVRFYLASQEMAVTFQDYDYDGNPYMPIGEIKADNNYPNPDCPNCGKGFLVGIEYVEVATEEWDEQRYPNVPYCPRCKWMILSEAESNG